MKVQKPKSNGASSELFKKKKYFFYKCRDCEIDFLISKTQQAGVHCPLCGEYFYTEKVMEIWVERPFQYKRRWTDEEDEIVIAGRAVGYTHQQISDSLDGRTMGAVRDRWLFLKGRKE